MSSKKVHTKILKLGDATKRATKEEIEKVKFAYTTDYQTGPNDETCAILVAYCIDDNWQIKSCVLHFKVFEGRTIGELYSEDLLKIFRNYDLNKESIVIVAAETTRK